MVERSDGPAVWIDGALVPGDQAAISPFDHGVTVGDGVFETLQVIRGGAFAARRHLGRLRRSAAGLGLSIPLDDGELRRAMTSTIAANRVERGRLRLTVTGGPGPLGSDRGDRTSTVIVATSELAEWPASTSVVIAPWPRNERSAVAGLKSTSYAENVVALSYAHERGASEAIFANTVGSLCEGTGTNVFLSVGGRLITPPLASGCLAGITRELVCDLLGDRVEQVDVAVSELLAADEAFLTSSTRDVQAIHSVDGHPLPMTPGPHTAAARAALADLLAHQIDP